MKDEELDDVAVARKLLRDVLWDINYHEEGLTNAHKKYAAAQAMIRRGGYGFTAEEALNKFNDNENEDDVFDTVDEYACYLIGDMMRYVEYHEKNLRGAHIKLAAVKKLLLRCNYTEFTVAEVLAEVQKDQDR